MGLGVREAAVLVEAAVRAAVAAAALGAVPGDAGGAAAIAAAEPACAAAAAAPTAGGATPSADVAAAGGAAAAGGDAAPEGSALALLVAPPAAAAAADSVEPVLGESAERAALISAWVRTPGARVADFQPHYAAWPLHRLRAWLVEAVDAAPGTGAGATTTSAVGPTAAIPTTTAAPASATAPSAIAPKVFASPFVRCFETAAEVARAVGVSSVCVEPALSESFCERFYARGQLRGRRRGSCCPRSGCSRPVRPRAPTPTTGPSCRYTSCCTGGGASRATGSWWYACGRSSILSRTRTLERPSCSSPTEARSVRCSRASRRCPRAPAATAASTSLTGPRMARRGGLRPWWPTWSTCARGPAQRSGTGRCPRRARRCGCPRAARASSQERARP
ncbi:unnamed protein product, partial [Prorocentrum cordatum]